MGAGAGTSENDAKVMISSSYSFCFSNGCSCLLAWGHGLRLSTRRGRQSQAENLTARKGGGGKREGGWAREKSAERTRSIFHTKRNPFSFLYGKFNPRRQAEKEELEPELEPGEAARRCSNFDKARQIVETLQTARCHKLLPCNQ